MRRSLVLLTTLGIMTGWTMAPAAESTSESRSSREEIRLLREQVAALTKLVKNLETRVLAQERPFEEGIRPVRPPGRTCIQAELGAPAANDPLAEAEKQLEQAQKASPTASAPSPAAVAPATTLPADPLAEAEADIQTIRSSAPSGNARTAFNPQISVIGDFVYRNSRLPQAIEGPPDASGEVPGTANRDRFSLRELEIAIQSPVDPWTRFDAYLAFPGLTEELTDDVTAPPEQAVEIEEAYATYSRLPWGLQLRGGKFRLEFGKANLEHTHAFMTADRPRVISNFLGDDGIREYGLSLSKQFSLGSPRTQLELVGQLVNGDGGESLFAGITSRLTMGVGRVRLYHEMDDSNNIDLGASVIDGHHDAWGRLIQRIWGYDLTFRHEPVGRSIYQNFILRAEYLQGRREVEGFFPDPLITELTPEGWYVLADYQFQRDMKIGIRWDDTDIARSQAAAADLGVYVPETHMWGPSVFFTYFTTEFNRFRIQYSQMRTDFSFAGGHRGDEIIQLVWTTSMGPHGAHRY